jgi:mannose-6-phosphate isomerase class I
VTYHTPAPEFQVSRWNVEPGTEIVTATGNRPWILLVTGGQVLVDGQPFKRGQSILIPACLEEFQVTSRGAAELFAVEVPSQQNT